MSARLQRVSRACPRGRVGMECDVCPRQLTAVECRPTLAPRALAASGRGSRPPRLRCTRRHRGPGAVLAGPSPVFRLYDQREPSPGVDGRARLTGLIAIFWGRSGSMKIEMSTMVGSSTASLRLMITLLGEVDNERGRPPRCVA